MSVIATREPIWLEFGATVKIAHADFSLTTASDSDDRSVTRVAAYPAHGNHYPRSARPSSLLFDAFVLVKGARYRAGRVARGPIRSHVPVVSRLPLESKSTSSSSNPRPNYVLAEFH